MQIPHDSILRGARRWLELLDTGMGIPKARAHLSTHPHFSDLSPAQYAESFSLLDKIGLLDGSKSSLATANRLLAAIFEHSAPAWFRDADILVRSADELPLDARSAGRALGMDSESVYSQLMSSWGKVDTQLRERIGFAGERELVTRLRQHTSAIVDHVSLESDGYGFDVVFQDGVVRGHLEVKSTTRRSRLAVYLSRHEFDVMVADSEWILVAVRLNSDLGLIGVGHVPSDWIRHNVSVDVGPYGNWASCKLEVPETVVQDGLPQLGDAVSKLVPAWH